MNKHERELIRLLAERSEENQKLRDRIMLLEIVIDELKNSDGHYSTDNEWAMRQISEVKARHPRMVRKTIIAVG